MKFFGKHTNNKYKADEANFGAFLPGLRCDRIVITSDEIILKDAVGYLVDLAQHGAVEIYQSKDHMIAANQRHLDLLLLLHKLGYASGALSKLYGVMAHIEDELKAIHSGDHAGLPSDKLLELIKILEMLSWQKADDMDVIAPEI